MAEVAPLAGAWIETCTRLNLVCIDASHPSRVRGLKLGQLTLTGCELASRTPRGCVD